MTRAFITLKNGSIINITADSFEMRDDWIVAWKGEFIVAFVKAEEVAFCYISEQNIKEVKNDSKTNRKTE